MEGRFFVLLYLGISPIKSFSLESDVGKGLQSCNVSPITIHDLLTEDEILKMREVAKEDARDLAMLDFHLLWGPRPSESAKLNIGDIKVTDRYIVVSIPQTKTIFRPLPIPLAKASSIKDPEFLDSALNAFVSMMHYLNVHPGFPDHREYPLWFDESNNGKIKSLDSYSLSRIFRRLGKRAGLEKNVSTYTLRRTAFNRFRGLDREKLCAGFGWKPGSRMPTQVYNKLRPQDYLETLIEEEGGKQRDIQTCPECGRENPKDLYFCVWCSCALDRSVMAETIEQFHADQKTQKEFQEMKDRLEKMEAILSGLVKIPGFHQIIEEAVKIRR